MTGADDTLALLDDYLSQSLSDAHAADFEEQLFAEAAEGRAAELGYLDALFAQAQWFVQRGGFASGTTAAQIAELRKLPQVHYLDIEADTQVSAWPEDTKYVVYRLNVDLRGWENIDVAVVTPQGEHRKWFRDVAYDPQDGALYGACDAPIAAATFRREPLIARIQASRSATGQREIVAELSVTPK
ncbi:MAG TPA: hypothetical protein VFK05_28400 [Polyangiaceae bacterium]|nr:hypothetical protein [Polyangiaceae bacterium]